MCGKLPDFPCAYSQTIGDVVCLDSLQPMFPDAEQEPVSLLTYLLTIILEIIKFCFLFTSLCFPSLMLSPVLTIDVNEPSITKSSGKSAACKQCET